MEFSCTFCEDSKRVNVDGFTSWDVLPRKIPIQQCQKTLQNVTKNFRNHSINTKCPKLKDEWKDLKPEWFKVE